MRSHWNWTRNVHKKNTDTMPRSGSGDRERERDATSTTGLERLTGRADWAKPSCVGPSRCAALRCVELRYLSGSWTLTEQSGGRVRLHERWYAATRVARHVSDRYMCVCNASIWSTTCNCGNICETRKPSRDGQREESICRTSKLKVKQASQTHTLLPSPYPRHCGENLQNLPVCAQEEAAQTRT